MSLIPTPKNCDDSVRIAIQKLASSKLGPTSSPTFAGLTLTGLTDNSIIYSASDVLTSLGAATNGQIPIGSTGAAPSLATITGTANQITSTAGAGSITLSTPQDIHTGASPTFANLSLGTGELTAGSINRASGTLALEIGGTAEISITSSSTTFGGNLVIPDAGYIGSTSDTSAIQIAANGEVTFTDVATGILPTAGAHLATKEYVDLSIGASFDFFVSNTASGVGSNYLMYPAETGEAESTVTSSALSQGDDQLCFAWLSEAGKPGTSTVREGIYDCHLHLNRAAGNKSVIIYWTLSFVDADGSSNETLFLTSEITGEITTSEVGYNIHGTLADETPTGTTKRLLFKVYANVGATGTNAVVTSTMEGNHDAHITVQLPSSVWQNQGDVLDDLNTLGQVGADSEFLVGTGAGAFAWESGATVRTSLGLGTGNSPQFTGIELGHASDTTLTRVSAGVVAIEGTNIAMVGGAHHDGFSDFVANEHIDHTSVTLTAGKGLSGGGDISTNRSFALDLTEMTGNVTWDDGSTDASITWTYALSGANDPVWTIGNNSMDLTTGALKQGGTQVMLIGDAPTAHVHDGDTLQLDAINSNGGAFAFNTTGEVTFNQTVNATFAGNITGNVTGNVTGSSGSCTGLSATATALATARSIGGVNFDGTAAIVPTTIVVADTADTSCYVGLWTDASGNLLPKTDGAILYNAGTGALTVGSLVTAGTVDGVDVSTHAALNIHDAVADTTDTSCWVGLFESATGDIAPKTDGGLTYNAGTATLTATTFVGALTGQADTVGTITGLAPDTATTQATQANITTCANLVTVGTIGTGVWNAGAVTSSGVGVFEGASVSVGKASTTTGTIKLYDSNSANTITLTVPDISAGSLTFTLPPTDGDNTNVLQTDGNGVLTWVAAAGGANHAILDGSVHTDSVADAVTRGSIIYGNSTPKWDELVIGTGFLRGDGTDCGWLSYANSLAAMSGQGAAAFDLNGQDLTNGGVLFLTEQAAAEANIAGKGQFWVKNTAPCRPSFDDDAGNEFSLDNRYVHRTGNPSAYDYTEATLTLNGAWQTLDLSAIVPTNAVAIHFVVQLYDETVGNIFDMHHPDDTNNYIYCAGAVFVSNQYMYQDWVVACNSTPAIAYRGTNTTWTICRFTVKGWWLAR